MRITEKRLRSVIRSIIKESYIQNEANQIVNVLDDFGVYDDESFLKIVLGENRNRVRENDDKVKMMRKNRRALDKETEARMMDIVIELDEKYDHLSEEKKIELTGILREIKAREDITSSEKIKRICSILGVGLMFAPMIIMIIGEALGITTADMTASFPSMLQFLTYGFGGGGAMLGLGSLFGLSALAGESEYHQDKIDHTQSRLDDLKNVRDSGRYK
jgi:hypothetical protein